MSEIKYRHPANHDLCWSGKGRQPKWVEAAIANGFSLAILSVANQQRADACLEPEIDLGIGEPAPPSLGTTLHAQRIVAGHTEMPEVVDGELQRAIEQATPQKSLPQPAVAVEVHPALPATETDGRDLLNQLLGQAQAFSAASQLLQTFGVSKLAFVKENKLYRALKGMAAPNAFGVFLEGTWEEFCGLLGMSDEKANQDIANLHAFGESALESMTRMGIGYRELRQFRKLPADQREALAQIALTGNKDDVLEAAMDAIEKERQAKGELKVKNAELADELRLAERRAKNLDAECERKDGQIKRLSSAKARCTEFLERTEDIRSECMALQAEAELPMATLKKLFEEVRTEDPGLPEWSLQMEQIWVTAHVVAARALEVVEFMKESVRDGEMPERVMGQHILGPAEAQRWLLDYPMIENRHAAEAAARQEKRDAARPKGPGRPKGSTNKAAAEE